MTELFEYCVLCREDLADRGPAVDTVPVGTEDGVRHAHRECMLREVMGGIGHLTDHALWCNARHDPDGGMSRRQSALAVDAWVVAHGVHAAAAVASGTKPGEGMGVRSTSLPIPEGWTDDS